METTEYLTLSKHHPGRLTDRQMKAMEVVRLIDPSTELFGKRMAFDGWPFDVVKYVVIPFASDSPSMPGSLLPKMTGQSKPKKHKEMPPWPACQNPASC